MTSTVVIALSFTYQISQEMKDDVHVSIVEIEIVS